VQSFKRIAKAGGGGTGRAPRWLLGAAVAAAGLTGAGSSRAGVGVGTPINGPIHGSLTNYISMEDCLADKSFTFQLTGISASAGNLEIWMSTSSASDCFDTNVRKPVNGGVPVCRQLSPSKQSISQVTLKVKDIIQSVNVLYSATAPPSVPGPECSSSFSPNGQKKPFYIYFLDSTASTGDGTTTSTGVTATTPTSNPWPGWADLAGPPPPTALNLKVGNGILVLDYNGSANDDVLQYRVYCGVNTWTGSASSSSASSSSASSSSASSSSASSSSASSSSASSSSASSGSASSGSASSGSASSGSASSGGAGGTGGAGGADAGADAGAPANCALPVGLVTGQIPPDDITPCETEPYGTARINVGKTKRLTNGTSYAIAIAGIDKVGNVGPLSTPICDAPQYTEDFFDAYKNAGGQAGGGCGLCSIGEPRGFSITAIAGTALTAIAFGARRRRRADRSRRGHR
jgi:hypothetical protein